MNGRFIGKTNDSNIFLITDNKISYYLSIPEQAVRVNIAINIYEGLNDKNVVSILSSIERDGLAVISPIFNSAVFTELKNNNQSIFLKLNEYLSYLINSVYNILKNKNKEVETKIILINYDMYSEFNDWFKLKYKERVNSIDVFDKKSEDEFKPTDITNIFKKEELGINSDNSFADGKASTVLDDVQNIVTSSSETKSVETKDMGFISYVLLGVVVAIVSLLLLYLLI